MMQAKQTVTDMLYGLAIWGMAVLLVLEIISRHRLAMAAGTAAGLLTAMGLIFHMYRHLDIALDMDSGHAQRHIQLAAVQRLAVMAVILAVSMTGYRYIHPVGTVLGIFGVKVSALLQPLVHRLRGKRKNGKQMS